MKRKKEIKLYVSPEEIAELHERYAPIFKQFNIDQDCGEFYIKEMVETTMTTLKREIEELSEKNRLDIETRNARINAANEEQIPRFFRPMRRFFRRTPNRAMAVILDEAAIAAEDRLSAFEHQNEIDNVAVDINLARLMTSEELPKNKKGKPLSRRELKNLLKDPEKLLALFISEEPEEEQSDVETNNQGEEAYQTITFEEVVEQVSENKPETNQPATLPKRKRRRRKPEAAEQTESPNEEQSDVEVNEGQPDQLQMESPNEGQPDQLPGQLEIEEINADDGE